MIVCLQDKKTVYEYTSIEVTRLPVTLQNEIKNEVNTWKVCRNYMAFWKITVVR